MTQPPRRDSRGHCRLAPGAPGTPTDTKAGPKPSPRAPREEPGSSRALGQRRAVQRSAVSAFLPRADGPRSSAARRGFTAALRGPGPCEQPGAPRGAPFVAWSDHLERPGTLGKASSSPWWTAGEEAKDGDSSVSSGRLSGSSGGHEPCVLPHRPWTERPPQVLGSPRPHRESSPRLEQLRDRIRAQARWQGSCASLGTSMPSSASHLHKASMPAPGQKVQKLKKPPAAPAYPVPQENPQNMKSSSCKREKSSALSARKAAKDKGESDSELVGAHAWRKGQALARGLLGPPPPLPRLQNKAASRETAHNLEIGDTDKVGAAGSHPVRPRTPSPAALRSYPQVPPSTPFRAPCDQAVTIQSALAILQDLRQQIQAGLELARDHQLRRGREQWPSPRWRRQEPAERRPQGACRAPDLRGSFSKSPWVPTKGMHSSSERAGSVPGQRWRTLARWESQPRRPWLAQGRDPAFQRPGSPRERLSYFPQRPWSASAGQRARATCEGWEAPARGPGSPLERPSPRVQRPWSASLTKWTGSPCEGRCSLPPPSGARNAWLGPARSTLQTAPRKDSEAQVPLPCPKTRGLLGRPYSPESLREFMRQKALVRRQQALEEKVSAVRALELRNQRLQDVYRKQREAVLGKAGPIKAGPVKAGPVKAGPVVSQTNPSIVTFVPHSAQSWDLEAPGGVGSPVLQWSKVTSGMVLGDQEAPGSFCLCLNGALDGAEPPEPAGPQESREGAPPLQSASPSLGRPGLRDLATQHPCPGLCIYLDPEESERLGTPGPLHFRYKQARLQALETMANILKQRIDVLTAKLLGAEAADAPKGLASDLPPSCPSTVPAASTPATPACPRALVPHGGRGAPWDLPARPLLSPASFLDGEALLWGPGWQQRRAVSPRAHPAGQPRGFVEDRCSELDKRLARNTASFQALCPLAGSICLLSPRTAHSFQNTLFQVIPPPPGCLCSHGAAASPSLHVEPRVTAAQTRPHQAGEPAGVNLCRPLPLAALSTPGRRPLPHGPWPSGPGLDTVRAREPCGPRGPDPHHPTLPAHVCVCVPSSPGVPEPPDPTCGSLWLEETPWARGAGSITPWTLQSCGQPGQLCAKHLADIQQKSLSFLRSLERHQQAQEQALALLRQRAESEVWETRRALDELLFKHRLERLMGSHATQARPGAAPELEGLQVCGDPDLKTSQSARWRSQPALGGDAAVPSQSSKEGQGRRAGHSASAEPEEEGRPDQALSQWLLARLHPGDSPIHQMLQKRLREQKLRTQHQAALLSLRKKALEEETRSELARLEPRRRWAQAPPPGFYEGNVAGLVAWTEQRRQALGSLEREQREIWYPWDSHLFSHHERILLLQHHRDILSVQRSLARLQQELQATTRLLQSSGPQIPAPRDGDSETSQQLEGPVQGTSRPPTPHRPGSPTSHRPRGSPGSPRVALLVTEQQDGTPPGATAAVDGHLQPLRPAWGQETPTAEGWPDAQGGPVESGSHVGHGDAQTNPGPQAAERESTALTEGHSQSFRGWSPHSPGREGPCSPGEASQAAEGRVGAESGLDFVGSPEGEAPAMESQRPEEQRTESRWHKDPHGPSSWQEAAQRTTCPAPAEAEGVTPPTQHQGSPLLQLTAPSGTCSGSSLGSRSLSPVSDLSCPSLQEFQKVSAFLVQLSESSTSLSDWEAGDSPDADLGWSGGSFPRDPGGLHEDRGQAAWEKPSGSGTSPLHGPSTVSGGPESEPGLWQRGWTPLSPNVPSPRAGSGLSEAHSEVWDQEGLLEPGTGAQLAVGCTSPAGGSDDLEDGGAPQAPLLSLGPGGGQEAAGTSGSLPSGSDTGKASWASPEAARTAFPSDPSSCSDPSLSLSFPSGASASKGAGFSKGVGPGPPQAFPGCAEGPRAAGLRAPPDRKPPEPPPGAPGLPAAPRAESWAPGPGGCGSAPVPEEAQPLPGSRVLQEILSPVDEVLSYGSADLPSCTHRDAHFPPLPPTLQAEVGATLSPHSEDFPSPPEDALCSGGSLSPPEEGASINSCELSSLSEEGPPEAPSPGSQGASLCPGASGQSRSLGDPLGESSSFGGNQAVGGQWSEPFDWLGSPSFGGAGNALSRTPRLSAQHPTLSRVDCAAGAGLLTPPTAGDTGLSGTWQGDPAPALDVGPCAGPPGMGRAQVVDLVSTRLTRRVLCDTLAALSDVAPPGSPTGERAGGSCVTGPPTGGLGSLGGDGTSEK
ncbi:coiled-coil domain-containing protein 187 [Artibeus jamaicensis]|uniref:coiled-coil domain-containing protein 187 n=1 Tax=Artibeus jamaicensis TaxID=9417 RepID=UPI00235A6BD0|nr:coiled-coil domain-containing protein 187 [Artibeus jamaicensis]